MAVVHRFGGSVGGAYGSGDVPAFSTADLGTGVVSLSAAQVVAGYAFGTPGAARTCTFPSASDLFTALKIVPGAPCQVPFSLTNLSTTAANTYIAVQGTNGTLAPVAGTAIAGGGSGVFIITFTNTSSSSAATYTITRIS